MKLFIISLTLLSSSLFASGYVVVVNQNSKIFELSSKQIKDIFIMKRHFVANEKLIPVNIAAGEKSRMEFEKIVLKMNREKLNNYWIKQHFHGMRPPIVQSSLNSTKLFIKNVDGSIGYLPADVIDSELRVIFEF